MISVTNSKLVKKRKEIQSGSSESSESENEAVNVQKYRENITDNSNSDVSPRKDDSKLKKRKHHHHHHHHHHKRKHRLTEGERVRHKVQEESLDEHDSRQYYSTHRRHAGDRGRQDDNGQYSNSSGRHRQHGDDSGDRIRHHRKRDGDSRQRRDETSRLKKPISIQERDQSGVRRDRRIGTGDSGRTGPRNEEQIVLPADRPIKQERVSPEGNHQWGKQSNTTENKNGPPVEKAKPNFGLSGKLAEETNTFNGVVLKYSEPPEARKPKRRWRFYPFKGDAGLPTLYLHRQSCYLIGRDRKVADIPVDHPSCSKQHAALQYRLVPYQREDGSTGRRVRPYIIDLESANGTYVNNNKIEPKKYIELLEKDVIKFGYSSREYVLLHEQSKDESMDDDVSGNLE